MSGNARGTLVRASRPSRNGSIVLRLRVADLGEVKRWLIGFGADALVLKPASLRREIAAECARMSSHKPLAH